MSKTILQYTVSSLPLSNALPVVVHGEARLNCQSFLDLHDVLRPEHMCRALVGAIQAMYKQVWAAHHVKHFALLGVAAFIPKGWHFLAR